MIINPCDNNDVLFSVTLTEDFNFCYEYPSWVVSPAALIGISVALILVYVIYRHMSRFSIMQVDLSLVGAGRVRLKVSKEDRQIAYNIWVELCTRKIGLEINYDDDVISEIYDSWYSFFTISRGLIGQIPVQKIHEKGTQFILEKSMEILNGDLRSHLTRWQARYRKWYALRITKDIREPQNIQRDYPQYDLLVADMKKVNLKLIEYRKAMYKLATGCEEPGIFSQGSNSSEQ